MFGNNSFGNNTFGGTTFGTGFGATPTLGAFGSTTQTAPQPAGPNGTTIRFVPMNASDTVQKTGANAGGSTQITTRHQNICAMKEYESKSVDELRFEDYQANRKVGQPQQPTFNSTPFSTMQPSTSQQSSIFGTNNQQNSMQYIFGQSKPAGFEVNNSPNLFNTSLNKPTTTVSNSPFTLGTQFNSTAPSASTQPGFSIFSNPTQTNTTPFGATSTVNNAFKPNPLFATPTSNTGSSIFNTNTNANTSAFMNSTQNNVNTNQTFGNSIFGNPTNNTNSLTSNNLFNTQQKTPFELNNASGTANIFGINKAPTTSIFGTQNKTGFEVNNSSNLFNTSLNKPATTVSNSPFTLGTQFNSTAPAANTQPGFSIFSNPTQTTNTLTGQSTVTNAFKPNLFATPTSNTGGSLFSTNTNANTSAFMTSAQNNATAPQPFGNSIFGNPASSTNSLTSNNLFNTQPKTNFEVNNASTTNIFDSLNKTTTSTMNNSLFQNQIPNNPQTSPQSPDLLMNRLKTLPYGETSLFINDTASPNSSVGYLKFTTDPKTIYQYKMNAKTNVKLNTPSSTEKTTTNSILFDGLDDNANDDLRCAIDVFVPKKSVKKLDLKPSSHLSEGDAEHNNYSDTTTTPERARSNPNIRSNRQNLLQGETSTPVRHVRYADNTYPGGPSDEINASIVSNIPASSPPVSDLSSIYKSSHSRSSVGSQSINTSSITSRGCVGARSCLINNRPDYKIKPSMEQLERAYNMETDTCIVDSFLIERPNYGSILFENGVDVKGLNLDEIVHIRRKEVVVYPDDENKPPIGRGLNRPAIVTLHQVWPIDKSNNEVIKDVDRLNFMRYPEKIESATLEKGARFIEYRPETGSWVFAVKHFSKYGITDDDEEVVPSPISTIPNQIQQSTPLQQHNHSTHNIQQTPQGNGLLLNRLKTAPFNESPTLLNNSRQQTKQSPSSNFVKPNESPFNQYKMSAKTNVKLNKPSPIQEKSRTNSAMFDSFDDSNYSMKNAIDELFEEDEFNEGNKSELKRSLTVHGTKRLALQVSPNISSASYERPITVGASVPKQQKVREIKLKPDLYAAQNKLTRDIMSVCVSGAPKVRFFNGSRKFCYPYGDSVMIHELKLVSSSSGSLSEDIRTKFETFLENHSKIVALNTNPILAPYIETNDFIPDASKHDLLHALYGKLSSKTPYAKQDERLGRVINWLAAVNRTLPQPKNIYQLIIYHMSCDRYDLASKLALENNHPRLALLVATLNLNKDLMFEQLSSWRISYADRFIDPELMKIYVLLSGLTEWKLSNDVTIYVLKGLNWSQQLSLLALHVTSFVSEPDKYGFHLLPLYMKRLDTNTNDVEYHILARHSPANILSAANTLAEEWFLLESLKSFGVIDLESECTTGFDVIHCNVASQLGQVDLRWACFVALHITNDEVRNQVLIKCLEQNQNQLKERKDVDHAETVESWLVEKLQLPEEFIKSAKALAARLTVSDKTEKMFKPS